MLIESPVPGDNHVHKIHNTYNKYKKYNYE